MVHVLFFPVYYWVNKKYKSQWLAKQPQRFLNLNELEISHMFNSKNYWLEDGLYSSVFFGLIFFSSNIINLNPVIPSEKMVYFVFFVLVSGYGMALINKFFIGPKLKNKTVATEKATSNL